MLRDNGLSLNLLCLHISKSSGVSGCFVFLSIYAKYDYPLVIVSWLILLLSLIIWNVFFFPNEFCISLYSFVFWLIRNLCVGVTWYSHTEIVRMFNTTPQSSDSHKILSLILNPKFCSESFLHYDK